ncbi:MAG: hypothetical protein APR53_02835 [Methanoculleus sp. SDB]|nr:MAG: hypothetical protein APR53_02835 [Methanoculleus sp. SDB]
MMTGDASFHIRIMEKYKNKRILFRDFPNLVFMKNHAMEQPPLLFAFKVFVRSFVQRISIELFDIPEFLQTTSQLMIAISPRTVISPFTSFPSGIGKSQKPSPKIYSDNRENRYYFSRIIPFLRRKIIHLPYSEMNTDDHYSRQDLTHKLNLTARMISNNQSNKIHTLISAFPIMPPQESLARSAFFLRDSDIKDRPVPDTGVHYPDFDAILRELKSLSSEVKESMKHRSIADEHPNSKSYPDALDVERISNKVIQMMDYRTKIAKERRVAL